MDKQKIEMVLADPAVSYWLKNALQAALKRDPVDAYRDAQLLVELLAPSPQQAALEAARHAEVLSNRPPRNAAEWIERVLR